MEIASLILSDSVSGGCYIIQQKADESNGCNPNATPVVPDKGKMTKFGGTRRPGHLTHFHPMPRTICLLLLLTLASALRAAVPLDERFRGGKVEWARLKTDSPHWDQHAERDIYVLGLMRTQTSLNIGDALHSARVNNLEEMCAYPFIFAENITTLSDTDGAKLAEYLRRGGFLLVDACIRVTVNPNADEFLAAQTRTLLKQFPNLRITPLAPDHEVFSVYFKMDKSPPQTRSGTNPSWAHGSTEPLRGLYLGDRMIGVISLSGFQCAWIGANRTATDAIQMVTNIYIYAMTR